ncbi:MAG: PLP-dependent aspartate aminotransferase family protein [Candidatus Neomarinimicrobiota bacterium]|nr:PLP-dependent aspartate aminotransferase family protein [Candidatus Neomarinimicrobiota bacterium]
MADKKYKFETRAIHKGNEADSKTGSVSPPIYLTSTYLQDGVGKDRGFDYSRASNPTRKRLEDNIASLETGTYAIAFSSGMAATTALFQTLNKGDHVIISRNVYGGTFRMATQVLSRQGLHFDFVDTRDSSNIHDWIKPNTKWVFIETPTNPLLELTDIKAVADLCKDANIKLTVDNTFMSPYGQRPLDLGADCVMHSSTKYIGGHSDVLGGVLVTRDDKLASQLYFIQKSGGAVPSPFDCWLRLRSTKTLSLRVKKASKNALKLAQMLSSHPSVVNTIYPGLETHPQHQLAKKQQKTPSGKSIYGSIVSIILESKKKCDDYLSKSNVFTLAESLGGVESLVCVPYEMTHADVPKEIKKSMGLVPELIRLSVGVEHIDDLMSDIGQALDI